MSETIDRKALESYVDRVLVLHVERAVINQDLSTVYEEAKNAGFVAAIVRQIVREKQMEAEERAAHYGLLDSYRRALGLLADTPLGEAAIEREVTVGRGTAGRPRPFAEQPLHRARATRGRPRKQPDLVDDMIGTANRVRRRPRRSAPLADLDPVGAAE